MFVYALFAVFVFAWPSPMASRLEELFTAFLFYFAMIWLSPLPWEWSGRQGEPPSAWRGAFQAFVFSETFVTILVLMESLARVLSGREAQPPAVYMLHLCFYGPAIFLVGNLVAHRERSQSERRAMTAQVAEAQSRQLQGQLHPHVLFNALNALAEVIQEDPAKAEANVRAMSSLLRRVLNASEASTFALAEEVALVKDYLSMEAMRLESRLRIAWDWDPTLDDWRTLPLMLQPLVENAVKHGIARSRTGGDLLICSRLETGVVVLEVRNTGVALGDSDAPGTGIGLKNLRRRLGMAYGDGARLQLRYEDGWTVAEIRIQMDRLSPSLSDASGRHPNLALEASGVQP